MAEAITIGGTGISTNGAIRNVADSNTLSGLITLAADAEIQIDTGTTLALNVASGNAITGTFNLTMDSVGTSSIADPIATSTGNLTKTGAGTLTLSGTNTYTGSTTLTAGTIKVASSANLGATPVAEDTDNIIFNGGTLTTTADFTLGTNKGITMTGDGTINTGAFTLTYGGVTTGSGNLTKTGAGTLTLSGTNTYTGDTTISAGTLTVTGTLSDSTDVAVSSGATYKLEVSDTIGSISGAGTVRVGDDFSFDAVVLTVDHSTAKTFSGNLIIPSGMDAHGFVKHGSGTLTLTTANTDAYGDITVTGGVLSITHNDALGNTTTTVNSGAALHLSNNITVYAGIRLNGSGVSSNGALRNVSGSNTLTQWLLLGTDTEIQVDSGSTLAISPTNHYSHAITGTYVGNNRHLTLDAQGTLSISKNINIGNKNLTKTGAGTLTLSGTNTYTGDTTISAGTLKLTGNLNSATDLVIAPSATLDLQAALTAATLDLDGTISNTAGTSSLIISGTANLGGSITTTGTQTYSGAVTLSAATITLTTTDSDVTFGGTIDSDAGQTNT